MKGPSFLSVDYFFSYRKIQLFQREIIFFHLEGFFMVNVIGKFTQMKPNDLLTNQIGKNFSLNKNTLSERKSIGEDSVDISQNRNLANLRAEVGVLKNELPIIIANSLLKPLSEGIVKEDPLNLY